MKGEALGEQIKNGLAYIGMERPKNITIALLFEVRRQLLKNMQDDKWYGRMFPKACLLDRERNIQPYSTDGITYISGQTGVTACILYNDPDRVERELNPPVQWTLPNGKYHYMNEIDHYFTHCINQYLLGKECRIGNCEEGLQAVHAAIPAAQTNANK